MSPYRVHIVYEHSADRRPYSSSHIRLLRPLTHPSLSHWLDVSAAPVLCEDPVDLIVVDRLWRHDVTGEQAQTLVDEVRRRRARLVYSLDDNLVELLTKVGGEAVERQLAALQVFLTTADRVIVSTWPLHDEILRFNSRITVIPNYLDERLLPYWALGTRGEYQRRLAKRREWLQAPVTVGYMGTLTHDEDLRLIAPVLRQVWRRYGSRVCFEIVGGVGDKGTWELFEGLPVRQLDPGVMHTEYPSFMPWYVGNCQWDIALAPLVDTTFNKCKSDIKFLDYAALGAAGVYSRVLAYERAVQQGATGVVVDNTVEAWASALEHLIEHPVETLSIGWAAQRWLRHYRTLAQGSVLWLNAIRLAATQGE